MLLKNINIFHIINKLYTKREIMFDNKKEKKSKKNRNLAKYFDLQVFSSNFLFIRRRLIHHQIKLKLEKIFTQL